MAVFGKCAQQSNDYFLEGKLVGVMSYVKVQARMDAVSGQPSYVAALVQPA